MSSDNDFSRMLKELQEQQPHLFEPNASPPLTAQQLAGPSSGLGDLPLLYPDRAPGLSPQPLFGDDLSSDAQQSGAAGLSEADLCERYIATHQPLVYERGRFWRMRFPNRPWEPIPEDHIAAELLACLYLNQDEGPDPTRHRLASVLSLLKLRLGAVVAAGRFDNTTGLIPFPSCIWPMHGGHLNADPYHHESFVATTLPYDFDRSARCPAWLNFLAATVPDDASFLQEFAGYCLTTETRYETSLWVCGGPSSGKSTLLHGLQTLLGPFAAPLSLTHLQQHTLDPDPLVGKRLLFVDEAPPTLTDVPNLTAIIDGAPLFLSRTRGRQEAVRLHAKLVLSFNGLPEAGPAYDSLYRRAAVVFCPPRPPASPPDHDLKDRISEEGPGLFNWAWQGWHRLMYRGYFEPPATMLAGALRLRLAAASPRYFVDQCCLRDPDARTGAAELIAAYGAWCKQQDLPPLKARRLADHWRDLGFERHLIHGRYWWHGVQVVQRAVSEGIGEATLAHPPRIAPPPSQTEPSNA